MHSGESMRRHAATRSASKELIPLLALRAPNQRYESFSIRMA